MNFFIPKQFAKTKKEACQARECMTNFAKESFGLETTNRKIYQIDFVRYGDRYEVRVGQPEHKSGEIVMAILESTNGYLVCTPNHGGYQGKPIVVGKPSAESVVEFED